MRGLRPVVTCEKGWGEILELCWELDPEKRATVGVVERKVEEVVRGLFLGGGGKGVGGIGDGEGRDSPYSPDFNPPPPPNPLAGKGGEGGNKGDISPLSGRRLRASTHRSSPSLPVSPRVTRVGGKGGGEKKKKERVQSDYAFEEEKKEEGEGGEGRSAEGESCIRGCINDFLGMVNNEMMHDVLFHVGKKPNEVRI